MIRIVGLSATLPNYKDVATFLGVNQNVGLFHFGPEYRPVPLAMSFIGVTEKNMLKRTKLMVDCTYDRISKSLKEGNQAMVFVHSRKDTAKTAEQLAELAAASGGLLSCPVFDLSFEQCSSSPVLRRRSCGTFVGCSLVCGWRCHPSPPRFPFLVNSLPWSRSKFCLECR